MKQRVSSRTSPCHQGPLEDSLGFVAAQVSVQWPMQPGNPAVQILVRATYQPVSQQGTIPSLLKEKFRTAPAGAVRKAGRS